MRQFTEYLLLHRWQALLLTLVITGLSLYIPVLGTASILIAAFFTLCLGVFEGAIFTLVATLPYLLFFTGSGHEAEAFALMKVWGAVVLISSNVLTLVFAVMLRKHCSWSSLVQIVALFAVLVISVIHLVYPDVASWWSQQLTYLYNQANAMTDLAKSGAESAAATNDGFLETINTIRNFATGFVTAYIFFTALIQVMLARWWQVVIVNRGRLGKELQQIRLSRLAGFLFMASLVLCYLENQVVLDILPVLCLLFGGAGLSLIHYLCSKMEPSKGRLCLLVLYAALIYSLAMMALLPLFTALNVMLPVMLAVMIFMISILAFVSLGFFDVWFDVRKRVRRKV